MKAAEFLGAEAAAAGTWHFALGRELHGAFGGVFGGVAAACTLVAARPLAPGRAPVALDCRFLRALPAGRVTASTRAVHAGRSLSCVVVEILDEWGRLATLATVSLAAPDALHPVERAADGLAPAGSRGSAWRRPPGVDAPIIDTFEPQIVAAGGDGVATALRVPWADPGAGAEAACLAADLCVGPPVAAALTDAWLPHPNPDLALRFAPGSTVGELVVGRGRLARVAGGVAVTHVDVFAGADLVAAGVATSLILPPAAPAPD